MSGPRQVFIGPRRRGSIARIVNDGKSWQGRRGKMRMRIWLSSQPTLEGERVKYQARLFGNTVEGYATSVADAIDHIEAVYIERTQIHERKPTAPSSPGRSTRRRRVSK